jgi:hypothetical protein
MSSMRSVLAAGCVIAAMTGAQSVAAQPSDLARPVVCGAFTTFGLTSDGRLQANFSQGCGIGQRAQLALRVVLSQPGPDLLLANKISALAPVPTSVSAEAMISCDGVARRYYTVTRTKYEGLAWGATQNVFYDITCEPTPAGPALTVS